MEKVRVRYMVNELDPAVNFLQPILAFRSSRESKPNFAMLERGHLELVLSTPFDPGEAAKPMSDGRNAEPGGWNRIILNVRDLPAEVARLRRASLHFRNDIVSGPGGSEILIDDPSGIRWNSFSPDDNEATSAFNARCFSHALQVDAITLNASSGDTDSAHRVSGCYR